MKIERVELHHISQQLVHPFRTSFGTQIERSCILVAVYSEGVVGWGEVVASTDPGYSYETVTTAWPTSNPTTCCGRSRISPPSSRTARAAAAIWARPPTRSARWTPCAAHRPVGWPRRAGC